MKIKLKLLLESVDLPVHEAPGKAGNYSGNQSREGAG